MIAHITMECYRRPLDDRMAIWLCTGRPGAGTL